jgi:hypothetical protein
MKVNESLQSTAAFWTHVLGRCLCVFWVWSRGWMAQDLAEFLDALHGQRQNRNGSCGSHGQDGRPHCRPRFKVLAPHRASGMPFGDGYVPWHHPGCPLGFFRDRWLMSWIWICSAAGCIGGPLRRSSLVARGAPNSARKSVLRAGGLQNSM